MSFALPPEGHPARDLFDVADIAEILHPTNRARVPGYANMASLLRRTVSTTAAVGATGVAVRANGDFVLLECGPKGGIRQRWNFGGGR